MVLSLRGDDFELTVGQDLSIGYRPTTPATVTLYLEESLTFRAAGPEAARNVRLSSRYSVTLSASWAGSRWRGPGPR